MGINSRHSPHLPALPSPLLTTELRPPSHTKAENAKSTESRRWLPNLFLPKWHILAGSIRLFVPKYFNGMKIRNW
jgi:hypothetical protein